MKRSPRNLARPRLRPRAARRRNADASAGPASRLPGVGLDTACDAAAGATATGATATGEGVAALVLEAAEAPLPTGSLAGGATPEAAVPTMGFDPLYPPDGYGSDAELVALARSDPDAFGRLYERYVDRIYSYCYHRVGNVQDAEDLTARTFHRALHALEHYEERGLPFAAWLFRIAHNLVANWHRDRSRRRFLSLDRIWSQRSEQDDPEGELERKESHDALWEAINRLPADRRDLLLYKFSGRMSNVEIGGALKKSESAVKSLYFRTLAALRKDLEAAGWGSEDGAASAAPFADALAGAGDGFETPDVAADALAAAEDGLLHVEIAALIETVSTGAPFTRE